MTTIIGGGISGLSAAYYAVNDARLVSVTLLEASSRIGGWINSKSSPSGAIFEQGPRTIKPYGPAGKNTLNLIEDLQLTDQLIHIKFNHVAMRNNVIYSNGVLHLLPISLKGIFNPVSLLDRSVISSLWTDLRAPKVSKEDESIYSFVERRLGQDIADKLISPWICGICAGDAREISVNLLFKSLFEAEQKHGSIAKGILMNWLKKSFSRSENNTAKKSTNTNDESTDSRITLAERAKKENWALWSLQGGLEQLPQALANNLERQGVKIQTGKKCDRLTFNSGHIELSANGDVQECTRVISSLPAKDLAGLLQEQHPTLSAELRAIPTVTVAVVNLEFQNDVLPLQAFGFLIPPKENLPVLGMTFDSSVFPQNSSTVLTVMMGGAWFKKYFGSNPTNESLLTTAIDQVREILCVTDEPVAHNVAVLKDCIPQYVVGHTQRVKRIHDYISAHGMPLGLCGSSYQGLGLNDVILSAKQAVRDVVK